MNFAAVIIELKELAARLRQPPYEDVLKEACGIVATQTQMNFIKSHEPDGTPWKPTRRQNPILILTGDLMTSAVSAAASPKITGRTALIEVPRPEYGEKHMTGAGHMPARPWIGVSEANVDEMADKGAEIVNDFLIG